MKYFLLVSFLFYSICTQAADSLKVLFIGNSYTDVNNLPGVIAELAAAGGDYLYYQKSVPGGYTFEQHSVYAPTINLIAQGNWDYVVLQEQSQRPSFSDGQVEAEVYPFARKLDSLIHAYNPCAETIFYMTWGRKNGDAMNCVVWPPVCTYAGMDSMLQLRYTIMADNNQAWLSPVAKVWRHIRDNSPSIELYNPDESHPSMAGTYAAALSFYALLYHKDPELNNYNAGLNATTANAIKAAAKIIVYDSLAQYWNSKPPLIASYSYTNNGSNFSFTSTSLGTITSYEWDFGDGTPHSNMPNPQHTFAGQPPYTVCLTVYNQCDTDRYCTQLNVTGIHEEGKTALFSVYPNPFERALRISGLKGKVNYVLYDQMGRRIMSGILSSADPVISAYELPKGIYWLRLTGEQGSEALKVVRD